MVAGNKDRFTGFSLNASAFLRNLAANNNKAWFEAHRKEYEEHLLEPLKTLVSDLSGFMLSIDPDFMTTPAVDRTISRIYRDTRFSMDKSPYKTTVWITFKRPVRNWQDSPCYFLELGTDSYRFGMGFYSAAKDTMDRLREIVDKRPAEFLKVVSFFAKQDVFVLEGEKYKKILKDTLPANLQEWYQRKNLYLVCNRNLDEALYGRKLVDDLISGFGLVAPLYRYLWKLKAVK